MAKAGKQKNSMQAPGVPYAINARRNAAKAKKRGKKMAGW